MAGRVNWTCPNCGMSTKYSSSDDGFFYCDICGNRVEDIVETGMDDEQIFSQYNASCTRVRRANPTPIEPVVPEVKTNVSELYDVPDILDHHNTEADGVGPTEPRDFGSFRKEFTYEEYYSEIRLRYLKGLQIMIQLQCQALIEKFNVSPLIIGLVGPIWLRLVASTRILADEWADSVIHDSEVQKQGEAEEFEPNANYRGEPVNIYGKRVVYIWYKCLRSTLPISSSLAISFLICHLAREPILPCDLLKWALEGKLPYFAAFVDIKKQLGFLSGACPIPVSRMFRPIQAMSSQKLESTAAEFAQKIGLVLPPVNFSAIASRYLSELTLPIGKLLPFSCRVFEWSNPPELYLCAHESRLPTRVCVMSILIVAIRILFNINGYGIWESNLSQSSNSEPCDTNFDIPDSRSSVVKLLKILEAKYYQLDDDDGHDYSCDLPSYLQYCKDVVFSGLHPGDEEENIMEILWEFYQENKIPGTSDKTERSETMKSCDDDQDSGNDKRRSIEKLKLDMNENQFCYIPPRVKVKNKDYLHYARKRDDVYIYAVHADYYILLRCCAKLAQVETRIMHTAVLSLERRLQWVEKKIEPALHFKPNIEDVCKFCEDKLHNNAEADIL